MATIAYLKLIDYQDKLLMGTSQVKGHENEIELIHWGWGAEQTLNIGSQSTGAGAGKVTFRPLRIQKTIDKATPLLFACCCSGPPFKEAVLMLARPIAKDAQTTAFLTFDMKLAAIKTVSYDEGDDPTETIEFEFGGVVLTFVPYSGEGKAGSAIVNGWNRVKNIAWTSGPIL